MKRRVLSIALAIVMIIGLVPLGSTNVSAADTFQTEPMVSSGSGISVVLRGDGTVWTWGWNGEGQLGNGSTQDSTPVQVSGLSNVVFVSVGGGFAVALKSDRTVWAWGYNGGGQLGNGTTEDSQTPVQVSGLSNIVSVSTGGGHTVALKNDGTVWAWGNNGYGELGNGSFSVGNATPAQVPDLSDVVSVFAGGNHTVAIKRDGTVWAWGTNWWGELGDGTSDNNRTTPVQVLGISNVVSVSAGASHTLALKSDGTVWAWGQSTFGHLGNATSSLTPVQIPELDDVIYISGGEMHTLALKSDKTVWAWGVNGFGEFGNGTTGGFASLTTIPVQALGLNDIISVSAGFGSTLAIKSDGSVWACGFNANQSDFNDLVYSPTPLQVVGENDIGCFNVYNIDLSVYLSKTAEKWPTVNGAKYFTESAADVDKATFVSKLTNSSLQNADSTSRRAINTKLYNLLYNATYRPQIFGGKTSDIAAGWPLQNINSNPKSGVSSSDMSIKDDGLGVTTDWNSTGNTAWGCFAYGRFASVYIYGATGTRDVNTYNGEAEIKAKFRESLDPGETIFYGNDPNTHAIVFLGESADGNGFYFISYGGGVPYYGGSNLSNIDVGYFSYSAFSAVTNGKNIRICNTNNGSYFAGSAKSVAYNVNTQKATITIDCPVEMTVSVEGQEAYTLDSRSITTDGGVITAPFGSMTATGSGDNRAIEVELNQVEDLNYSITVIGTGEGTMDMTFVYEYTEDDVLGTQQDIRTFKNVPVTEETTTRIAGLSVRNTTELDVDDGSGGDLSIWEANQNETVYSATEGYLPYIPYYGEDEDTYTITASAGTGGSISPSSDVSISEGESQTFTITPSSGYKISNVIVDGTSVGAVTTYTFKDVTSNHSIIAQFSKTDTPVPTYTIAAASGTGGYISPTGNISVSEGQSQTFTITPNSGYKISSVKVDGKNVGVVKTYTFENINANHSISAEFVIISPELNTDNTAYVNGYEDGTVRPEAQITREEVAAIFYRLMTEESRDYFETSANNFSDVASDRWSNRAISTLANAGILNGYEDGKFRPGNPITRAELVKIVISIGGISGENSNNPFTDVSGHWAYSHIVSAANTGWITGYEDGTFRPNKNITRAEAMAIVNRVLGRDGSDISNITDTKTWSDNSDTSKWYYKAVQIATNSY